MHPDFLVLLLQQDRRREAAMARRDHAPRTPRTSRAVPAWRESLGHGLVGLGHRLAAEQPA